MLKKKVLFVLAMGMVFIGSTTTAREVRQSKPAWLKKTIIPKDKFIYSIGHSQPKKTEQEARDEALANATKEFVRYCKVDVQSFDRSMEIYSKEQGKEFFKSDFAAQSIIRAKAFVTRAIPEDWYIRKEKKKFIVSVLLKVPKEEFDRIANEKNIKLSLDVLFYYEDENRKMKILTEGSVLKSGDSYAIYVRPSDSCYLYVYQVDALGKSYRLFPNPDFNTGANPLPPAGDIWIPNTNELFELDETTGKEYFYIFASPDRINEFVGKNALNLTKKDIDSVIEIKKMGVAGIRQKRDREKVAPPKRTRQVAEVKKKLQAEGAFVYEAWFWHK